MASRFHRMQRVAIYDLDWNSRRDTVEVLTSATYLAGAGGKVKPVVDVSSCIAGYLIVAILRGDDLAFDVLRPYWRVKSERNQEPENPNP